MARRFGVFRGDLSSAPRTTYGHVSPQPGLTGFASGLNEAFCSVSDGNRQWLSIVLGGLLPSCFHTIRFHLTDSCQAVGLSKRGFAQNYEADEQFDIR